MHCHEKLRKLLECSYELACGFYGNGWVDGCQKKTTTTKREMFEEIWSTKSDSYHSFKVCVGQLVSTIDYGKLFVVIGIYEACSNVLCHQSCWIIHSFTSSDFFVPNSIITWFGTVIQWAISDNNHNLLFSFLFPTLPLSYICITSLIPMGVWYLTKYQPPHR